MRIGDLELKNPFIAAPLAGVTDAPTRSIASRMGAALTYSEMVSGKGLMYSNRNTEDLLYIRPEEYLTDHGQEGATEDAGATGRTTERGAAKTNVGFQIFGREPDVIEWTAKTLASRDNAVLDINMGCPVPKIVKNGEGSALMKEPELAGRIVAAAVSGARAGADEINRDLPPEEHVRPKPVTVKMRAGWDDDSVNAVSVALECEKAGAAAVTIHGRTRDQYYSGRADRDIIREVKNALSIPVIGNGDIFSAGDAISMMEETGCDAVMIARGALGNPWIYREAAELWAGRPARQRPDIDEIYEMMKTHFSLLMEDKGEKRAVFEMRKHVGWYLKGQPHAAGIRRRINTITSAEELMAELERGGR